MLDKRNFKKIMTNKQAFKHGLDGDRLFETAVRLGCKSAASRSGAGEVELIGNQCLTEGFDEHGFVVIRLGRTGKVVARQVSGRV